MITSENSTKTRRHILFRRIIQLLILIATIIGFLESHLETFELQSYSLLNTGVIGLFALFIMLLPDIFERKYQINFPLEFEIMIVLFIYLSLFLGEIRDFYTKIWWWDIFLHFISGIILGTIGFLILYFLYDQKMLKASPFIIAVFTFSFGLALGTIWEIFEFSSDMIFGTNTQRDSLIDTMTDLIVDSIGSLIVSLSGFFYIKGVRFGFFSRMLDKFIISYDSIESKSPSKLRTNKMKR